jgi:hypothetical protein
MSIKFYVYNENLLDNAVEIFAPLTLQGLDVAFCHGGRHTEIAQKI